VRGRGRRRRARRGRRSIDHGSRSRLPRRRRSIWRSAGWPPSGGSVRPQHRRALDGGTAPAAAQPSRGDRAALWPAIRRTSASVRSLNRCAHAPSGCCGRPTLLLQRSPPRCAHDPGRALERGWSITRRGDGRLARASDLRAGTVLHTLLVDGEVRSVVEATTTVAEP
jgi:hypothetical protein